MYLIFSGLREKYPHGIFRYFRQVHEFPPPSFLFYVSDLTQYYYDDLGNPYIKKTGV